MVSRGEWYQVTEKGKYEGGDKSWIKAVELKAKVSGQPLATLFGCGGPSHRVIPNSSTEATDRAESHCQEVYAEASV